MSRNSRAGKLPPLTLSIGRASSLPSQMPMTRRAGEADEPGVAEILRGAGLAGDAPAGTAAARPVPRATTASSIRRIAAASSGAMARCGAGRGTGRAAAGRLRAGDAERRDPQPAIGEGGIGGGQVQQRHLPGAEREGGVVREAAVEPEPPRRRGRRARPAGAEQHPHGGGVDRLRQRLLHR